MLRSFRDMGDDRTPLEWLMTSNLMDKRNELLSYPLKKAAPYLFEGMASEKPHVVLATLGLAAYAAAPTFLGNIWLPTKLLSAGTRPLPVYEGISYVKTVTGWPMPRFHYFHGASPAYKAGARVGGKVGGRIGARLIPGVGWALLAYDVYDVAANRSLWGFDLS
jgi:hypothetical protein